MGGSSSTMSNNNSEMERMVNLFGSSNEKKMYLEKLNEQNLNMYTIDDVLVKICETEKEEMKRERLEAKEKGTNIRQKILDKCNKKYPWLREMLQEKKMLKILDPNIFYSVGLKPIPFMRPGGSNAFIPYRSNMINFLPADGVYANIRHFVDGRIAFSELLMINFTEEDLIFHKKYGEDYNANRIPYIEPLPDSKEQDTDLVPENYDEEAINNIKGLMRVKGMDNIWGFFGDISVYEKPIQRGGIGVGVGPLRTIQTAKRISPVSSRPAKTARTYRSTGKAGEEIRYKYYKKYKSTDKEVKKYINRIIEGQGGLYILYIHLFRKIKCDEPISFETLKRKEGHYYFINPCNKGILRPYVLAKRLMLTVTIDCNNKQIYIIFPDSWSSKVSERELYESIIYLLDPLIKKDFKIIRPSCDFIEKFFSKSEDNLLCKGHTYSGKYKKNMFREKNLIAKKIQYRVCDGRKWEQNIFGKILCNSILFYYIRLKMLNPHLDDTIIYRYLGLEDGAIGVINYERLFYLLNNQDQNIIKNKAVAEKIAKELKEQRKQIAGAIEYIEQMAGYY